MNKKLRVLFSIQVVLFMCGISSCAMPPSKPKVDTASPAAPPASVAPLGNQNILGISVGPTSGVRGVAVKAVAPGSPCEGVLKPGDIIFAVTPTGQPGSRVNMDNYQAEVSKIQPGMTVKLLLDLRTIREVSCTIPADAQPPAPPASPTAAPRQ
jgi:hypothetical protein